MPSLNFKPQFAKPVEDGTKVQTLRQTARAKAGDLVSLYTGMMHKHCRLLGYGIVECVLPIEIHVDYMACDGDRMPDAWAHGFAQRDGFKTYADMIAFFRQMYVDGPPKKKRKSFPLSLFLIQWRKITAAEAVEYKAAIEIAKKSARKLMKQIREDRAAIAKMRAKGISDKEIAIALNISEEDPLFSRE